MLDTLVDLSWRGVPTAAMAIVGLALTARGVRLGWRWAHHHDSAHNLRFVSGFRFAVTGLALISVAAAWQWHMLWLLILALAIAFEEILESSIHAFAIKRGLQLEAERQQLEGS